MPSTAPQVDFERSEFKLIQGETCEHLLKRLTGFKLMPWDIRIKTLVQCTNTQWKAFINWLCSLYHPARDPGIRELMSNPTLQGYVPQIPTLNALIVHGRYNELWGLWRCSKTEREKKLREYVAQHGVYDMRKGWRYCAQQRTIIRAMDAFTLALILRKARHAEIADPYIHNRRELASMSRKEQGWNYTKITPEAWQSYAFHLRVPSVISRCYAKSSGLYEYSLGYTIFDNERLRKMAVLLGQGGRWAALGEAGLEDDDIKEYIRVNGVDDCLRGVTAIYAKNRKDKYRAIEDDLELEISFQWKRIQRKLEKHLRNLKRRYHKLPVVQELSRRAAFLHWNNEFLCGIEIDRAWAERAISIKRKQNLKEKRRLLKRIEEIAGEQNLQSTERSSNFWWELGH